LVTALVFSAGLGAGIVVTRRMHATSMRGHRDGAAMSIDPGPARRRPIVVCYGHLLPGAGDEAAALLDALLARSARTEEAVAA